ncbi:hypothetical protein ASZ90_017120 [hydrocarbon metagenome]|uniref:Uncharacterized protein n=1 Tax=hydrocarbon metagenome TaxID=938273 RepID=A0A0W8EA80_9ZZZZ
MSVESTDDPSVDPEIETSDWAVPVSETCEPSLDVSTRDESNSIISVSEREGSVERDSVSVESTDDPSVDPEIITSDWAVSKTSLDVSTRDESGSII